MCVCVLSQLYRCLSSYRERRPHSIFIGPYQASGNRQIIKCRKVSIASNIGSEL